MTSHFVKRYTQVNLKRSQDHLLISNDVSSVSNNSSSFRTTQDSSNIHNNIAVKSKRNRTYFDEEDDERVARSANRKRLTSKRSDVEQNTKKAKSSSSSDLHSFIQFVSVDETSRRDDVTEKLNGTTSFKVKEKFSWRSYDEDYDFRVIELVIVTKKKRSNSKVAKNRSALKVIAIRKLSDLSRNISLSMLLRIQRKYFVKCANAYEFEIEIYVVLEHMSIFLVQVVAALVHSKETHVISIVD